MGIPAAEAHSRRCLDLLAAHHARSLVVVEAVAGELARARSGRLLSSRRGAGASNGIGDVLTGIITTSRGCVHGSRWCGSSKGRQNAILLCQTCSCCFARGVSVVIWRADTMAQSVVATFPQKAASKAFAGLEQPASSANGQADVHKRVTNAEGRQPLTVLAAIRNIHHPYSHIWWKCYILCGLDACSHRNRVTNVPACNHMHCNAEASQ
jgi:hypothetical protein